MMIRLPRTPLLLLGIAALSGCVAPTGPVEVTRFHAPEAQATARGLIRIEAAPGQDGQSIEFRSYAGAVARELTRLGYTEAIPGSAAPAQVAVLAIDRRAFQPQRARGPVSVGAGGTAGSYGSGVGLGLAIDLSGPPPEQVVTEMRVAIRDAASGRAFWEGRASFTVRSASPLAQTSLGAAKMAEALFKDFPGRSGETILVK